LSGIHFFILVRWSPPRSAWPGRPAPPARPPAT